MAKKVVATLKTGKGKEYSKVITMTKSPKTVLILSKKLLFTMITFRMLLLHLKNNFNIL